MSYSRRHLYAHGEPLGESVTRRKLGGGYICGGGGSESSSSQSTSNVDRRIAVQDGIGVSGDANALQLTSTTNTTTNVLDAGAIREAFGFGRSALSTAGDTFGRALDSVDVSNATLGQGYEQLLGAAEKLFDRGETLIGQTQQAVADAYTRAQDTAKGTIDNRTIIVLAVAGAAAAALIATRGSK